MEPWQEKLPRSAETGELALKIAQIYYERCGDTMKIIPACCLQECPAFFLFPKEHLAFYEIEALFDIEVAYSQAEAEKCRYFTISERDPSGLHAKINQWLHQDHLLS
jgi:hypothetical protein